MRRAPTLPRTLLRPPAPDPAAGLAEPGAAQKDCRDRADRELAVAYLGKRNVASIFQQSKRRSHDVDSICQCDVSVGVGVDCELAVLCGGAVLHQHSRADAELRATVLWPRTRLLHAGRSGCA